MVPVRTRHCTDLRLSRPVFPAQAGNAAEFSFVCGDDNEVALMGLSSDQQIVRPYGTTRPFQSRSNPTCSPRVLIVKRNRDRKSTRLNSSHPSISYAVFCLKKKKK